MNTNNQFQQAQLSQTLTRPDWLRQNYRQYVILCRDDSGSMYGSKRDDSVQSSIGLVKELANPVNHDGFMVSVIDFADSAKMIHNFKSTTQLYQKLEESIIPDMGGGTNITAGLKKSLKLLKRIKPTPDQSITELRPVVLLFTDGGHNTGPHPQEIAEKLKQIADLVTIAFGTDADENLLEALATTPGHFYRCTNGRELRRFLAKAGATLTATMSAGTNATQALTQIN